MGSPLVLYLFFIAHSTMTRYWLVLDYYKANHKVKKKEKSKQNLMPPKTELHGFYSPIFGISKIISVKYLDGRKIIISTQIIEKKRGSNDMKP